MSNIDIIFYGLEMFFGVMVLITVLMQPSKSDALSGLIQGNTTESFFSKNKSRTKEVILERLTMIFMCLFAFNTLVITFV